ncbi:MAG: diaminopimelate epimerase [Candidatus Lokiarchaeota archaeon]
MKSLIIDNFNFEKYHGLGNDYIIVNDIYYNIPESFKPKLALKLCEQHFSVGADGLIFIIKAEGQGDIKMRIFNNDGSEAEMCGNGIRCFAKYIYEHGICNKDLIEIETLKGLIDARLSFSEQDKNVVNSVEINMGSPILKCSEIPVIPENNSDQCINEPLLALDKIFRFSAVSMGNPHVVIFVKTELDDKDLSTYGAVIENHERFPNKTNVEFVKVISNSECILRVFERGVGITNSCGTGSCAAVVAGVILGKFKQNVPVLVHNDGGDLIITYSNNSVLMKGPIEKVFTGSIPNLTTQ